MKIHGAKKIHYDSGPNMTPLVDIVMVILIFLMMTGSFGAAEHYLISDVPLEVKGAGAVPPPSGPIPTQFTIKVSQEGKYYIAKAGNFASVKDTDPDKAYKTLKDDLAEQLKNFSAAGIAAGDIRVVIDPSSTVNLENLIVIMDAAQDAGFTKIGFGVNQ
jgi:biopolymer transport protein ExbD